ncbi:MAG: hypothetical protein U0838_12420 [Chloroflexota bacterium]
MSNAAPSAPSSSRGRSAAAGVVGFLAVLAIVLGTVAGTLHGVVLSPDNLAAVVAPVGADPQVQAAVADKAADRIVTQLDIEGRARSLLPGPTGPLLAPGIARGVADRLSSAIEDALASDAFQRRWEQVVLASATVTVRVLKGESAAITTTDGVIYLNLLPAIGGTLDALKAQGLIDASIQLPDLSDPQTPAQQAIARLSSVLGISLPPDFGQVPLAQTAALEKAQGIVAAFDTASFVLIVAAIVLTLLAVAMAADRRAMIIRIGISAAILVAALPPLVRLAEHAVNAAITAPGMSVVTAAFLETIVDAVSWPLRIVAAGCLLAALVAMLAGALSGPGSKRAASFLPVIAGGVAFVVVAMVVGPDAALLAVALVAAGAWITGRPLLLATSASAA